VTTPSSSTGTSTGENLLRDLAPQVLGAVTRRFGDFAAAEDAVQEALLAAALQWPEQGVPDNPRGWLIHVAARRMTDHLRAELARRRRETIVLMQSPDQQAAPDESFAFLDSGFGGAGIEHGADQDDTPGRCSRPSARDGRRPRGGDHTLPGCGGPDDERAGTELSRHSGRPACRRAQMTPSTGEQHLVLRP
jgi:hypothetical protein